MGRATPIPTLPLLVRRFRFFGNADRDAEMCEGLVSRLADEERAAGASSGDKS